MFEMEYARDGPSSILVPRIVRPFLLRSPAVVALDPRVAGQSPPKLAAQILHPFGFTDEEFRPLKKALGDWIKSVKSANAKRANAAAHSLAKLARVDVPSPSQTAPSPGLREATTSLPPPPVAVEPKEEKGKGPLDTGSSSETIPSADEAPDSWEELEEDSVSVCPSLSAVPRVAGGCKKATYLGTHKEYPAHVTYNVPMYYGEPPKKSYLEFQATNDPVPNPDEVLVRWALTPEEMLFLVLSCPDLRIRFTNEWVCHHAASSALRDVLIHAAYRLAAPGGELVMMVHHQDYRHGESNRRVWVCSPPGSAEANTVASQAYIDCRHDPFLCDCVPRDTPIVFVDTINEVRPSSLAREIKARRIYSVHQEFPAAAETLSPGYSYERTADGRVIVSVPQGPFPSRLVPAADWLRLKAWAGEGEALSWCTVRHSRLHKVVVEFTPADPELSNATILDIVSRRMSWDFNDYYGEVDHRFVHTVTQMYDRSDYTAHLLPSLGPISLAVLRLTKWMKRAHWLREDPAAPVGPTARMWSAGAELIADFAGMTGIVTRVTVSRRVVAAAALSLAGRERTEKTFSEALDAAKRYRNRVNEEPEYRQALLAACIAFIDVDDSIDIFNVVKANIPRVAAYATSKRSAFAQEARSWARYALVGLVGLSAFKAYRKRKTLVVAAGAVNLPEWLDRYRHGPSHYAPSVVRALEYARDISARAPSTDETRELVRSVAVRGYQWGRVALQHATNLVRLALSQLGVNQVVRPVLEALDLPCPNFGLWVELFFHGRVPGYGQDATWASWLVRTVVAAPVIEEAIKRGLARINPVGPTIFAVCEFIEKLPYLSAPGDYMLALLPVLLHPLWAKMPYHKGVFWHAVWNLCMFGVNFAIALNDPSNFSYSGGTMDWKLWALFGFGLLMYLAWGGTPGAASATTHWRWAPQVTRTNFCCQRGEVNVEELLSRPIYDGLWNHPMNSTAIHPPSKMHCVARVGCRLYGIGCEKYRVEVCRKCTCNEGEALMKRLANPTPDPHLGFWGEWTTFLQNYASRLFFGSPTMAALERISEEAYVRHLDPPKRVKFFQGKSVAGTTAALIQYFLIKFGFSKTDEGLLKGAERSIEMPAFEEPGIGSAPGFTLPTGFTPRLIGADGIGAWLYHAGPWAYTIEHALLDETRKVISLEDLEAHEYLCEHFREGHCVWVTKGLNANEKGRFFELCLGAATEVWGPIGIVGMDGVKYDSASKLHLRGPAVAVLQRLGASLAFVWGMLATGWRVTVRTTTGWVYTGNGSMVSGEPATSLLHAFVNGSTSLFCAQQIALGVPPRQRPPKLTAEDKLRIVPQVIARITGLLGWNWFDLRKWVVPDYTAALAEVKARIEEDAPLGGRQSPALPTQPWTPPVVDLATLARFPVARNPGLRAIALVDGDDNMTFMDRALVTPENGDAMITHMANLGIPMEVQLFPDPEMADYCSGFHYPCLVKGVRTRIHAAIIGRWLGKGGFCRHDYNPRKQIDWLHTVYQAALVDHNHVPVLRAVARKVWEFASKGKTLKYHKDDSYRCHAAQMGEVSEETWRFVEKRYGIGRDQFLILEQVIAEITVLPALIDHPVLDLIMLKDFPELC